jgi:hypothetical protein
MLLILPIRGAHVQDFSQPARAVTPIPDSRLPSRLARVFANVLRPANSLSQDFHFGILGARNYTLDRLRSQTFFILGGDVKGDYERIMARGAEFTMPPTDVPGSTIARLNDTCGNLIQLTQLARWSS